MSDKSIYLKQIGILDFWHKTEFFIPFNLNESLKDKSRPEYIYQFNKTQLWNITNPNQLWKVNVAPNEYISGFNLYLAIFNHKDITSRVNQELESLGLSKKNEFEDERRSQNVMTEGDTCFAKIKLNEIGGLIPNSIEVSAAPWAMGQIIKDGFNSLDFFKFDNDLIELKKTLTKCYLQYIEPQKQDGVHYSEIPLNGKLICYLIKELFEWAGYKPKHNENDVIAKIQVITKKKANQQEENDSDKNREPQEKEIILDINILNSFYAKDIANVIRKLKNGIHNPVLERYLSPISVHQRTDLYSEDGRKLIYQNLSPQYLNSGHWFSEPIHKMSLMQQFAINTLFKDKQNVALFSVNGPPVTGKTTLLRDIFAENIVRRASVLAKYRKPTDAFTKNKKVVSFNGENNCYISQLKPELTGFEMVVTSSNNAAVENISKELPQIKSLGKSWLIAEQQPNVSYLTNIMYNLSEQKDDCYKLISGDESVWGLFSIALGKKANRIRFTSNFYFEGKDKKHFSPERHQSVWNWRKVNFVATHYEKIKRGFINKEKEINDEIKALMEYIEQNEFFKQNDILSFKEEATINLAHLENNLKENSLALIENEQLQHENMQLLKNAQDQVVWFEKNKPSLFSMLFNTQQNKSYQTQKSEAVDKVKQIFSEKESLLSKMHVLNKEKSALNKQYQAQQEYLAELDKQWECKLNKYKLLEKQFQGITFPEDLNSLEEEKWQIDGLWFSETLNQKRSELFHLALQLHEAWLLEVLQEGKGFGANLIAIRNMLSGKHPHCAEDALAIWQSLFMVVPVVSTTFAAFATQFRDLDKESLGWLFIDEAGQASPQMAVGALWRAKQAIVVGDPLQIEPVVTIDGNLIEALKKVSELPSEQDYSPNKISVQNLADLANPFGVDIGDGDNDQWLGSPLRVHRRCVEPMFSISNQIAYQGKMIYFDIEDPKKRLPPKNTINIGESAWVNIAGVAENKHIVLEQIKLVHQALVQFYLQHKKMPPVYIISPFKGIYLRLVTYLKTKNHWFSVTNEMLLNEQKAFYSALNHFCHKNIGTVHTFQGKEESVVWMVLGCDKENISAANWASSKPNLLNVALTRAKHRFFMIGDYQLWSELPYFSQARNHLPVISPQAFIDNILQSKNK